MNDWGEGDCRSLWNEGLGSEGLDGLGDRVVRGMGTEKMKHWGHRTGIMRT